ncbi:MAG: type II toxin-antitoxin system RelE/ParE family toxin [Chloroflexota bacterium]|nr:type II toxin-antitoxin system RelE/ParE family toxin [Chloroflexota bacterium]
MQRVIFHSEAYKEFEQARAWYEEQAQGLGNHFLAEVDRAVEMIRESPDAWLSYGTHTHRFLFHSFPFAIVYWHNETEIRVVAVMHLKCKPGYLNRCSQGQDR